MDSPRSIKIEGISTRYYESGNGTPLLLIHGGQFGDYYSSFNWGLNWEGLTNYFHVIAYDKPGHGYTGNPLSDRDYTIEMVIEHAHKLMKKLKLKEAIVLGHSRGAFVAAALAIRYPELVKGAVFVDTNTLAPDDPSTPADFYSNIEKRLPKIPTRESVRWEPEANSYTKGHITEEWVGQMCRIAKLPTIIEAQEKRTLPLWPRFINDLDRKRSGMIRLLKKGSLKQPVLIAWGLKDPSAPFILAVKLYSIIAAKNFRTELHSFNSGHYCFREFPSSFNQMVISFAKTI